MMRILVVSNLYPPIVVGGYELLCAAVVEHLQTRHEVAVLTTRKRADEAPRVPGVHRTLPSISTGRQDLAVAPRHALAGARAAREMLVTFSPDLVYIWNGTMIPQAALRVVESHGVPVVFAVCEHWYSNIYRRDLFTRYLLTDATRRHAPLRWVMRVWNQRADLRLSMTEAIPAAIHWNSDAMRALNAVPRTTLPVLERTIRHGSPRGEAFSRLPREPSSPPAILYFGRVVRAKGSHVIVEALGLLRDATTGPLHLRIAGPADEAYEREIRALAKALGVADRVTFLGALNERELGREISRATVGVVPSLWQEPFALAPVEGATARLPMIISRTGGSAESFTDGVEALFFDAGDAAELADCLALTLSDPAGADRRAAAAFLRANEYAFPLYVERVAGFLEEAIKVIRPRRSVRAKLPDHG